MDHASRKLFIKLQLSGAYIQKKLSKWVLLSEAMNVLLEVLLDWPPLESRWRISRLQALYKRINNLSGLSIPCYFLPTQRSTRHHHFHHFIQPSTSCYQYSFLQGHIRDWINLHAASNDHRIWKYWYINWSFIAMVCCISVRMCDFFRGFDHPPSTVVQLKSNHIEDSSARIKSPSRQLSQSQVNQ